MMILARRLQYSKGFTLPCQLRAVAVAQAHLSRSYSADAAQLSVLGHDYIRDDWTNIPASILSFLPRRLHLQPSHPISLTRELITSRFDSPTYTHYKDLSPIVSVRQNFDSLGFPLDHPGRSKTDTYYLNSTTCLRTHTSAHQADTFRSNVTDGYTISADVYRRDAVDRSHYPVFHQMEGARLWNRRKEPTGRVTNTIISDISKLPRHQLAVEDCGPVVEPTTNPLQKGHTLDEVEVLAAHLKRSLEDVVVTIFSAAQTVKQPSCGSGPLKVRWVEAYFPFTSPSWELEVYWRGEWLEILGCGVVQQPILDGADASHKIGWAFGLGIERIAMLLYDIPDIRLFWSTDQRFLAQFSRNMPIKSFVPFSKHPPCWKDISFWIPGDGSGTVHTAGAEAAGGPCSSQPQGSATFHENDMMELVREVAGDLAEDVRLVDEFVHPKTKQKSMCYRINYRSLERTLKNEEVNHLHEGVASALRDKLGCTLR